MQSTYNSMKCLSYNTGKYYIVCVYVICNYVYGGLLFNSLTEYNISVPTQKPKRIIPLIYEFLLYWESISLYAQSVMKYSLGRRRSGTIDINRENKNYIIIYNKY